MGSKIINQGFGVALVTVAVLCGTVPHVRAGPIVFINDYPGFLSAAGDVRTIDFETLPDGSASIAGTQITPEFNYTDQGVTFLGHAATPTIAGNAEAGFGLKVDSYPLPNRNWIIANLSPTANAVGVWFPSFTTLTIFGSDGDILAQQFLGSNGDNFLGYVSDVPIARATVDRGRSAEIIEAFHFGAIPEPATMMLLATGGLGLVAYFRFIVRASAKGV